MRAAAGRGTRDRLSRTEPFEVFTRPQRSTPARIAGLIVRMRAEITVAVLAVTVWLWLVDQVPAATAGILLGVTTLAVVAWPGSRRYLSRRVWAVLTRHRLRQTFVERRVMNYSGNLPILLWSRPTAVGERVRVLLRAGIDAHDLELACSYAAVACVASEVRVLAHRRFPILVLVDVVRRDPLAAPVPSPLRLVPAPVSAPRVGGGLGA